MQYDVSTIQDYDKLRKLQLTQLEFLKYVNDFCLKNKRLIKTGFYIFYFAFYMFDMTYWVRFRILVM